MLSDWGIGDEGQDMFYSIMETVVGSKFSKELSDSVGSKRNTQTR